MSATVPLRLIPVFPSTSLGEDVLARGGRCFAVRQGGAVADGDVLVAVPAASGGRQVLIPRGLGRPIVARTAPGGWVVEGTGEVCGTRRWCAVGGLAARVRSYVLPRGPAVAVAPLRRPAAPGSQWLAVRIENPMLVALAGTSPTLRRGPVAVVDKRVREVSPQARAAGVAVGMSLRLAMRKCPGLRVVAPPPASAAEAVRGLLEAEVGEVMAQRGGLAVRVGGSSVGELMAHAEHLALRLWQELGVHVRLTIAAEPEAAMRLTRLLELDQVAFIPAAGAAVWRRRGARARRGGWAGKGLVDVEGIVAMARALVDGGGAGSAVGTLRLKAAGRELAIRCGKPEVRAASQVETALRARAMELGEVERMEWRAVAVEVPRAAQQLSLLARAR
ncbi:hypothetical protein LBMAG42_03030 [Deltaproteobacteria bacterium]|nr:hypothetical protein LBMAG42_03030 [Deltaproteobacteria bacterium]